LPLSGTNRDIPEKNCSELIASIHHSVIAIIRAGPFGGLALIIQILFLAQDIQHLL